MFAEIRGTLRTPVLQSPDAMPGTHWFPGSSLNFAENLLGEPSQDLAIVFRGEHGVSNRLTRAELHAAVSRLAQAMQAQGLTAGDRVAAFLPNVPETVIVMLAATSLGAVFTSCSPDFGVAGAVDRFGQVEPQLLFAVDGYFFKGKTIDCRTKVGEIAAQLPSVKKLVLVPYAELGDGPETSVPLTEFVAPFTAREILFDEFPFDHPLYILYSSGTTGAPKCIVHGAGGTLLQHLKEHRLHTDIRPGDRLFYFTTCGWMMWNWLVSGLASGATLMLYDGSPFHPTASALFDYVSEENINVFGTSARYLEEVRKLGLQPRQTQTLTGLRTILSTGSPLAPEAYDYVYDAVKHDVQLASISGGTDIVSCFMLGSPTLPVHRGEIQCAGLGMAVATYDESGKAVVDVPAELVCEKSFPAMPIGFWNDPAGERYQDAYFRRFPGVWHHGDYAVTTANNGYIILGRSDAVLNPGGVRIGTAEIYRQVDQVPEVLESIVVGQRFKHDVRVVLFVKLQPDKHLNNALRSAISEKIRRHATPRHVPAKIIQAPDIPRTRSGKLVELAVRDIIHGQPIANIEAIANPEVLDFFRHLTELKEG